MVKEPAVASLVLVSGAAGSVTLDIQRRLRQVFANDLVLDFDPEQYFLSWVKPGARVVVAGGDGTVGFAGGGGRWRRGDAPSRSPALLNAQAPRTIFEAFRWTQAREPTMLFRSGLLIVALTAMVAASASSARDALAKTSTPPATGYDVSYPQCGSTLPSGGGFGIVGVNGGKAWSANPCLLDEYRWAATRTSPPAFYMNTGNPGTLSTHWGIPGPKPCANYTNPASVNDPGCAYNYGWRAAEEAFTRASQTTSPAAAAGAFWWADVEIANSWDGTTAANFADITGGLDFLRSKGVQAGVYSTRYQWAQIAGSNALPTTPNWVAGASSLKQATAFCSSSYSFTGGPVRLVQFPSGNFDGDYRCP
jgi:hypothetical protein